MKMYKMIQSPVINSNNVLALQCSQTNRNKYQRYSSVDELYNGKSQYNQNSSRVLQNSQDRIANEGGKTARKQKQRAHSQKKLTLTTANSTNITNATYTPVMNTHNSPLINARQAFQGFKKNLQLNSNFNKTSPLEKKGKFSSLKGSQTAKFPSSNSTIRFESTPLIQQKQNQGQLIEKFSLQAQKQRSRALLQTNTINFRQQSNPQNFYKQPQPFYTAPNSPVYTQPLIQKHQPLNSYKKQFPLQQQSSQHKQLLQIFNQKLTLLKQQTNKITLQNSLKIKQLQSLLLVNKYQLQTKNDKIRQLQMQLLLKQSPTIKKQLSPHSSQTSINLNSNNNVSTNNNNNNDYLSSRLNDLQKKIQVISKWASDEQLKMNQKIQKLNGYLDAFVQVKLHNIKFTLKAFINKNQQKLADVADKINKVNEIIKLDHIESYQTVLDKSKSFHSLLKSISSPLIHPATINLHQKPQFKQLNSIQNPYQAHTQKYDDMKNTMNTYNSSSLKNKTIAQQSFQDMKLSRDINDSFWNGMEDFSLHQESVKMEQQSFTDDSFSYAASGVHGNMNSTTNGFNSNSNTMYLNPISTVNSSCHQFALGSFPSFSKFSIDINQHNSNQNSIISSPGCKESIQMPKNSNSKFNSIYYEQSSRSGSLIQALEQISKYRNGPVIAYIDASGYMRYKGSQSYIFDRKGNILQPTKSQIEYCLLKQLIKIE